MSATDVAPTFDPFDPVFRTDPYPVYARLREENPVHPSALGGLVVTRHADCLHVLRHPAASSDERNSDLFRAMQEAGEVDEELVDARPFLFLDPPDHTRLRRLVTKAFTPRTIERLRPRVQELVDDLLDARTGTGSIELVEDFAYLVPVQIISELLGVPPEDHERFKGWSRDLARGLDPDFILPPEVVEKRKQAIDAFSAYFHELIAERRRAPQDDLLSALVAAEDAGDRLTERELLSTCTLLLVAGHETTVNLIANGTLALLRHPDELRRLRDDPSIARTAVEELLRFDPPVQLTARVALEDMEIGGQTLAKGTSAILLLGSANRDEAAFAEPDQLDIGRTDNHHLAFGFGTHFCLGAPLARLEGEVALTTLVRRFPDLALATDAPRYKENLVLRGLEELPLSL
ncbi:MAG TPA: cytochrome P450 [Acidimicrobiales bacterium]|nr:cytochrome P450 [Acidimicrobiales bacterium]